jgi:hypothetical protein
MVPVTYESSSPVTQTRGTQVSVVDTTTGADLKVEGGAEDKDKAAAASKTAHHKTHSLHGRLGKFPAPRMTASARDMGYTLPAGQVEMWSGTNKRVVSVPRGPKIAETGDSSFPNY